MKDNWKRVKFNEKLEGFWTFYSTKYPCRTKKFRDRWMKPGMKAGTLFIKKEVIRK